MSRRPLLLALSGFVAIVCSAGVLSGGASVAATRTTVSVRALPAVVGTTTASSTTAATGNRDLVVAWTNHRLAGRTITFYGYSGSSTSATYTKRAKTSSVGEAVISGRGLAKLRWRVVAARTSRTSGASASMKVATVWKQGFFDDFNGTALSNLWRHRDPKTWLPGRTCTYSSPSRVSVSSGAARLSTRRIGTSRPAGIAGKRPSLSTFRKTCKDKTGRASVYESAALDTATHDLKQFELSTGVVAARIKFSPRPGQHAAFWLPAPRARGTEIDVFESNGNYRDSRGNSRAASSGVYYGTSSKVQKVHANAYTTWSKNYHTFSVEWTASQYIFRVDSKVVLRTSKGATRAKHAISLTNFVADWAIKNNAGNDGSGLASTMYVDWVKAWTK